MFWLTRLFGRQRVTVPPLCLLKQQLTCAPLNKTPLFVSEKKLSRVLG